MIAYQQRPGFRQGAGAKRGDESLKSGAIADVLGGRYKLRGQAQPDARTDGFNGGRIDGLIADFRYGTIELRVQETVFGGHVTPPM